MAQRYIALYTLFYTANSANCITNMFLSIIIPVYNLPKELLKECIESIIALGADIGDYEIIVSDDGSAEPPVWIEEEYTEFPIKLLINRHGCLGAARNHGIEAARGQYIQFVDGDDTLIYSNAMQQCVAVLHKESPDILRFNLTREKPTKGKKRKKRVKFSNTISGALFMQENNLPGSACSYFIKRELLETKALRFSTGIYHEDEEFSTIAHYHAKTLISSNAVLYHYRQRESSITGKKEKAATEKRLSDRMAILSKVATFRKEHESSSNSIQKRALQRKLSTLAADAIINYIQAGKSSRDTHAMCMQQLAPHSLYPLTGNYSIKYRIFKALAGSLTGIRILRLIIPTRK